MSKTKQWSFGKVPGGYGNTEPPKPPKSVKLDDDLKAQYPHELTFFLEDRLRDATAKDTYVMAGEMADAWIASRQLQRDVDPKQRRRVAEGIKARIRNFVRLRQVNELGGYDHQYGQDISGYRWAS